ncbi:amino acid transporter AVT1I-like [Chrysoperla carnea]|uniref:amino acid transporter AVT1I-like n=1 Tax=Chrysoperla carnea TaxID=189513 RepID=UPI001D077018|nr:amino acid transporter AVT1I-like [Chrysoperla carnea]
MDNSNSSNNQQFESVRNSILTDASNYGSQNQLINGFERNQDRNLNNTTQNNESNQGENKHGLSIFQAAIFVVGEMAGSGVLALPKAIVETGWIGLILVVILCFNAGFGGTCLGACWDIIEERFPEHRGRTRNPYATIANRAIGRWGSVLVSGCVQFTLFGASTVYLLLASQIIQDLFTPYFPNITFCTWFLIIAITLTIPMWLGSPKDFNFVGIGAILSTAFACVFIFTQIVMDGLNDTVDPVKHTPHTFHDFFMAFGIILFSFGGASTFPTIQNDMINKKDFQKSIVIAFSIILALYLPVTAGGYFVYGDDVHPNIILSLSDSGLVTLANLCMAFHLIFAFLIVINPVCQELEEIFQVPHEYSIKRCVLRTFMIIVMIFIGETIPEFGKILSLVGGSTVTLLTFVFPCFFYLKLCSQNDSAQPSIEWWPQRFIPLHVKVYLWELIIIGLIGGVVATYSALLSIISHDSMSTSCWASFF